MRRVVITGIGIVSSLGCDVQAVTDSLLSGLSGLVSYPRMGEAGLKCHVYAPVSGFDPSRLTKRQSLTMSQSACFAHSATADAISDANLSLSDQDPDRIALVIATSLGGIQDASALNGFREAGKKSRAGATGVVKIMASGAVGNVAAIMGFRGPAYAISNSTASGTDCIGHAFELIRYGLADIVICGAVEEDSWRQLGPSLASWQGLPTHYNDHPTKACRPFDVNREGTVLSSGCGMLVLESLDSALSRQCSIYAEIGGFGSAGDGSDILQPSGEAERCAITQALYMFDPSHCCIPQYINAHGTGTRLGDSVEAKVLRQLFGSEVLVSSTKGLSGHALGATGALEAIYTLLMLKDSFLAPSTNLENISPECSGLNFVHETIHKSCDIMLSVNVALGGFASCILFRKISESY